jgi:hypothetical protein
MISTTELDWAILQHKCYIYVIKLKECLDFLDKNDLETIT